MGRVTQGCVSADVAIGWLGKKRYMRYLGLCQGKDKHERAIALYFWNSKVASVALRDVGHLEIALRNAYDRELSRQYPSWAIDRDGDLFRREQGMSQARRRQAEQNRRSSKELSRAWRSRSEPSHDDIVAALSFGFWGSLTSKARTSLFWSGMLSELFPDSVERRLVHELVSRIVRFRNRLAHNEPVFSTSTGLYDRLGDVKAPFDLVAPEVSEFVSANSGVEAAIAECPVNDLVRRDPR